MADVLYIDEDEYPLNGCFITSNGLHSIESHHKPSVGEMSKIFCDPVHGHISLHPICVAIIDTPEFQRLRNIKQTGLLEYIYPGATHNRFGHSLGVCHLAGKFIRHIAERQPELHITYSDILCVEIAALCHDLGHGPLSHTWEIFMNKSSSRKGITHAWQHEKVSENMFHYLIAKNNLNPELQKYGIGAFEIDLVKQLIRGDKSENGDKAFMYQIVNNDDSGLDVDKWDYFLRDCYYLGIPCNFEYQRLIEFAKVLLVKGRQQICYRDKVIEGVYNVFRTRSELHKLAYQHKVLKVMDLMFYDAMLEADGKVLSPSGEKMHFWEWSMSAAFGHGDLLFHALEKYCSLTDSLVFSCLKYSMNPDLERAVTLINAIEKRSCKCCGFYQQISRKISAVPIHADTILGGIKDLLPSVGAEVTQEFLTAISCDTHYNLVPVSIYDIDVSVISINWGKKDMNPVEFVHFYSKEHPFKVDIFNHEESSVILPRSFEEIQVHVVCKRSDKYAIEVVRRCFEEYWQGFSKNSSHL